MANTCLGNFSICNTCEYQHFSYLAERNYCERSEVASVILKPDCLPTCSYYCPRMISISPKHLCGDNLLSYLFNNDKDYGIKKVIFNEPLTIVLWNNGDKTIVKCQEEDIYDPEKGLAMAICKYVYGNKSRYNEIFKKWLPEDVSDGSEGNTQ